MSGLFEGWFGVAQSLGNVFGLKQLTSPLLGVFSAGTVYLLTNLRSIFGSSGRGLFWQISGLKNRCFVIFKNSFGAPYKLFWHYFRPVKAHFKLYFELKKVNISKNDIFGQNICPQREWGFDNFQAQKRRFLDTLLNFWELIWINCPPLGLFWAQTLAKWPRC